MRNKVSSPASFTSGIKENNQVENNPSNGAYTFLVSLIGKAMNFKLEKLTKYKLISFLLFMVCAWGFPYTAVEVRGWLKGALYLNLSGCAIAFCAYLMLMAGEYERLSRGR